jgi:adenylyl-sulfate kinase
LDNIVWQEHKITRKNREDIKKQKGTALWFTGLSGSGKSTIANEVEKELFYQNKHTYILDGDNIRHGLNNDLGFSSNDRSENIRRIAEVAKLFVDAGLIVLVSFISPFQKDRELAKKIIGQEDFIEIFVDASFQECAKRDPKGLYKKALNGEIKNFTGLDSPYEKPENPDIYINSSKITIRESTKKILDFLTCSK